LTREREREKPNQADRPVTLKAIVKTKNVILEGIRLRE